jgi:hypothetical protein
MNLLKTNFSNKLTKFMQSQVVFSYCQGIQAKMKVYPYKCTYLFHCNRLPAASFVSWERIIWFVDFRV